MFYMKIYILTNQSDLLPRLHLKLASVHHKVVCALQLRVHFLNGENVLDEGVEIKAVGQCEHQFMEVHFEGCVEECVAKQNSDGYRNVAELECQKQTVSVRVARDEFENRLFDHSQMAQERLCCE